MNKMSIGGHDAIIRYDEELAMWRGEFTGLNGGADFYAADIEALQVEGAKSLRVFLDVCREQGIEHIVSEYSEGGANATKQMGSRLDASSITAMQVPKESVGLLKIRDFLHAMEGKLTFMGNQYRLVVDGRDHCIDLLLFHRRLHCMVAIDLVFGKFQPEFLVNKMQYNLAALNNRVRQEDENPSIGIILCREKNRTIVEYALHDRSKPIGVAAYEITKTLPRELVGQLPSPKEILALLEEIE